MFTGAFRLDAAETDETGKGVEGGREQLWSCWYLGEKEEGVFSAYMGKGALRPNVFSSFQGVA